MGVPYERQRAFVRVFGGNFIMTRTVSMKLFPKANVAGNSSLPGLFCLALSYPPFAVILSTT